MRNSPDSLVDDLQEALDRAESAEVKFHIRQALQHVETRRVQRESVQTE